MNRNDQKSINNLYTEAVLQGAAGKQSNTQLNSSPEIEAIKAEIGAPGGMLLDEFSDLALKALEAAGMSTQGLSYNKLFKTIGKVLGAEIEYNKGEDDEGYVFADIGYDYGQDISQQ